MSEQLRPNILYLHSHDTGRYIQPYGYGLRSPHLQRLAEDAVTFRRAYSAAPTCSPSRAGLLTGQCTHSSGMLGLAHRGFRLHDPSQHLATTLRDAGYRTVLAGAQHVTAGDPRELGYTKVHDEAHERTPATIAAAVATIREAARDWGQPFFLDVGFFETHRPFPAAPADAGRYLAPPAPLPDTPRTRQDMADYQQMLTDFDNASGEILGALEEFGLAENTLVIVTTDHGVAFPMMKSNLTDHGVGVMLIMRGPGGFIGGKVNDALVSQIDLYPTICELAGIERPHWLQGHSLLPLMRGEARAIRDEVFAEVTYHAAYEPQRMIRTERYALIQRFGEGRSPVLANIDESPSRDVLLEAGLAEVELPKIALYDTFFDPHQRVNLAESTNYREVRDDLLSRLDRWMRDTDDPLLRGDVPPPPGARVNVPDARSASETPWVADDRSELRPPT
ncbi:MAG: sulfatase [Chloroflexota bacterium]|nr:sulfatase [Chloroflexota bacterium]